MRDKSRSPSLDKYHAKTRAVYPPRDPDRGNHALAMRYDVNLVLLNRGITPTSRRHSARIMGRDIIRTVFRSTLNDLINYISATFQLHICTLRYKSGFTITCTGVTRSFKHFSAVQ